MITKEYLQSLIKDPIPEPNEYYSPDLNWNSEHEAYYSGRNSAFMEIISNL